MALVLGWSNQEQTAPSLYNETYYGYVDIIQPVIPLGEEITARFDLWGRIERSIRSGSWTKKEPSTGSWLRKQQVGSPDQWGRR